MSALRASDGDVVSAYTMATRALEAANGNADAANQILLNYLELRETQERRAHVLPVAHPVQDSPRTGAPNSSTAASVHPTNNIELMIEMGFSRVRKYICLCVCVQANSNVRS